MKKLLLFILISLSFSEDISTNYKKTTLSDRLVSNIINFKFNKSDSINFITNDYLNTLDSHQKSELYNSLKQNIAFNMILTGIIPVSGHYRINKVKRGLKIVRIGFLAFAAPFTPFALGADSDFLYLGVGAAFISIPISYLSIIIDSGFQTSKYNKKIKKIIFN